MQAPVVFRHKRMVVFTVGSVRKRNGKASISQIKTFSLRHFTFKSVLKKKKKTRKWKLLSSIQNTLFLKHTNLISTQSFIRDFQRIDLKDLLVSQSLMQVFFPPSHLRMYLMKNFIYCALTFPKRHTNLCCMRGDGESLIESS